MINKMQLKQLKNFSNYFVNPSGDMYSRLSGKLRLIHPSTTYDGYLHHVITDDQGKRRLYRVNRAVATAFIPNPNNLSDVHHIDEDKTNNNADNLMWVSHLQNMQSGTQIQRKSKPVVLTNIKTGEKLYFKSGMEARRLGYQVNHVLSDKHTQKTTKGYTVEWDDPNKYL